MREAGFSMASDVGCRCPECLMEDDFDAVDVLLTKALAALRSGNIRAARVHIGRARTIALSWI